MQAVPSARLPAGPTIYAYFARWQAEGVFDHLNGLLRGKVRQAEGRDAEPTACVIDSESIKTSGNVPDGDQGKDAGKKIIGPYLELAQSVGR